MASFEKFSLQTLRYYFWFNPLLRQIWGEWLRGLTLSWRRSLSYRNQSIDLLCKSVDWVLMFKLWPHVLTNVLLSIMIFYWVERKFSPTFLKKCPVKSWKIMSPIKQKLLLEVSLFGVILVRICPHLDWIQRDMEYLSV